MTSSKRGKTAASKKGAIVQASLARSSRATLAAAPEGDEPIELDAEDEAEVSRGIVEIKSGKFVGTDRARSFLRRR